MTTYHAIDAHQNETQSGHRFGYVFVGDGGLYFTWRYDPDATHADQVRQVVDTLEEDEIDPPAGRWSLGSVERSLRHHIAQHGLHPLPCP